MSEGGSKRNILIAIPNSEFAEGLKKHIERENYKVCEIIVVLEHLIDTIDGFAEEGVKIEGIILTTDIAKKLDDKRLEYLADTLFKVRERYSHIDLVVLANEKAGHPLLAELISMGIYNIFTKEKGNNKLSIPQIIQALEKGFPFSKVSHFRNVDSSIPWRNKTGQPILEEPNNKDKKNQETESNNQIKVENKVIEKVVERIVEIKVPQMIAIPNKLIAVASLYPGAGSTFLISNLAKILNELHVPIGVLEPVGVKPIWYELLFGMKNAPSNWVSFASQIKTHQTIKTESVWQEENIVWMPLEPNFNGNDWTQDDTYTLINIARQVPIILADISTNWDEDMVKAIINMATEIWVVVGSSPVKVNCYKDRLIRLKTHHSKTIVVGNYWDPFINKKEIQHEWTESLGYIENGTEYFFDVAATMSRYGEEVTQAEWEGNFLYDIKKTKDQIFKELFPLVNRVVPRELLQQRKKSKFKFRNKWVRI